MFSIVFPSHPACFCKDREAGDDVFADLRDEPQGDIPVAPNWGNLQKCWGKKNMNQEDPMRYHFALQFCIYGIYIIIYILYISHFWTTSTFKGPSSQSEFGSCLVTPADIRPGGTKLISKTSFLSSTWQDALGRTVNETPDGLLSMLTSF